MQITSLEQIIDGVKAFLPTGVQAEISMDGDNIIVKYIDDSIEILAQDEFGHLIQGGIYTLDDPSQLIMEKVEETKNYVRHRLEDPKTCKVGSFRTKQVNKEGDKLVFCKDKETNKMKAQSKLDVKEDVATLCDKIDKVDDDVKELIDTLQASRGMSMDEALELKPFRIFVKGDNRALDIVYGEDEEDAKNRLVKEWKSVNLEDIDRVEEVPEDHETVTEKYFMKHMSSEGPDASGEVTFKPTAFGYDYIATDEEFNDYKYKPQWTTLRTIESVKIWFRNVLFEFGAEVVQIGNDVWRRSDFKESLNENKLCAMARLEHIAKRAADTETRQKAVTLLDSIGIGVDVKEETEKFLKEFDKKHKNESKEIDMEKSMLEELAEILEEVNNEFEQVVVEPKRYIVQQIDVEGDDVDQEEYDNIIDAVNAYKTLSSRSYLPVEIVDTKTDEILATTMGHIDEEFKDTMITAGEVELTDINDIDMPQAMADTIVTDEEGQVVSTEEIVAEVNAKLDFIADQITDIAANVEVGQDNISDEVADEIADEVADEVIEEIEEITEPESEEEIEEIENIDEPEEVIEESYKKFIRKGQYEDLQKTKQEIDKASAQGKSAEEVKAIIDLTADDEKEKEEAEKYAVSKLTESLFNTAKTSVLNELLK